MREIAFTWRCSQADLTSQIFIIQDRSNLKSGGNAAHHNDINMRESLDGISRMIPLPHQRTADMVKVNKITYQKNAEKFYQLKTH